MARETEIPDELTAEEIGEMSDETEREIARSAFDAEEPTGDDDRSLEQMENIEGQLTGDDDEQLEPEDEEPQDQEAAEADQGEEVAEEPQRAVEDGSRVPGSRLGEMADRARAAERERNELRERIARLEGAQQARQQQPPQPPQQRPDSVLDPDAYDRYRDNRYEQRQIERTAKMIDAAAADPDDGWKVQAAGAYIKRTFDQNNPAHMQTLERLTVYSADPAASIVKYWERNGGAAEVREREAAINEERRQRLEAEAAQFGYQLTPARRQSQSRTAIETDAPRHVVTRVPGKSLNGVSGHGGNGRNRVNDPEYETDGSEAAIFRSAFQD